MKKVNFEGETANPVHALHTSAKKTHTGTVHTRTITQN